MANTQETIADIIAEMRALSDSILDGIIAINGKIIADRLEAAHRREVATTKESLAVGNSGDCAKLREALETLRELLGDLLRLGDAEYHDDFSNFCDIIDAALAAPPRNCDVYNNESCRMAYHLHGDGLMTMQAFADWLFAPATEQEGGAK